MAFLGVGLLLVVIPVASIGYGNWQQRELTSEWTGVMAAVPPTVEALPVPEPSAAPAGSQPTPAATARPIVTARTSVPIAFGLRIPKIAYYAAVREGVSRSVLYAGPGHYTTTANPGYPGTVGIAAHNTYWLGVGKLEPGDVIVLETRYGSFSYRVTRTAIVAPTDGSVLAQQPGRNLTLTTCWPLWAGALAPQRLAIFATEVSASGT